MLHGGRCSRCMLHVGSHVSHDSLTDCRRLSCRRVGKHQSSHSRGTIIPRLVGYRSARRTNGPAPPPLLLGTFPIRSVSQPVARDRQTDRRTHSSSRAQWVATRWTYNRRQTSTTTTPPSTRNSPVCTVYLIYLHPADVVEVSPFVTPRNF